MAKSKKSVQENAQVPAQVENLNVPAQVPAQVENAQVPEMELDTINSKYLCAYAFRNRMQDGQKFRKDAIAMYRAWRKGQETTNASLYNCLNRELSQDCLTRLVQYLCKRHRISELGEKKLSFYYIQLFIEKELKREFFSTDTDNKRRGVIANYLRVTKVTKENAKTAAK